MEKQTKLDLLAAGAILVMFFGAFLLTVTSLGLLLIAAGAILVLLLILKAVRKEQ